MSKESDQLPIPQPILVPLTQAAVFLVVTISPDNQSYAVVKAFCSHLAALIRAVEARDVDASLTCVVAFGSGAWDRLFNSTRPAGLHPFREFHSGSRHAIATPGDVLFHIRAQRTDMCFELATRIMEALGSSVLIADEAQGFRFFDNRDLIGFVDGAENPRGKLAFEAALVGSEDAAFTGGSYVIIQKYLHDMKGWNALSTEEQELIIGRQKLSDIELDDSVKPASAHTALTVIEERGQELKILRDNMPFGCPGHGEFGTYFIGYSRSPRVTELMLENMFVGRPSGNYDRLLDFSLAITGGLFFAPSLTFLESASTKQRAAIDSGLLLPPTGLPLTTTLRNESLRIGSLKRKGHE